MVESLFQDFHDYAAETTVHITESTKNLRATESCVSVPVVTAMATRLVLVPAKVRVESGSVDKEGSALSTGKATGLACTWWAVGWV